MTDSPDSGVRAEVGETLAAMITEGEFDMDAATFETPWQARAFAIAVALCADDAYDWEEFQRRFIERLEKTDPTTMQADVERVYYEQWLATVEELLATTGLITGDELDGRQSEFEAGERGESEFMLSELPDHVG